MKACERLAVVALSVLGCSKSADPAASIEDAGPDVPSWLGDAGLSPRAPSTKPLHAICGLALPPSQMPLGDDDASRALRKLALDSALDLGGVAIRTDFRWETIEPTKGGFEFVGYDRLVADANARSVRLLGVLAYGTPWSNATSKGDVYYPPDHPEDFASYAKATAARYAGKVAAWEVWNEPNNGFRFWKTSLSGEPARYATLLSVASPAIHAGDAKATVLLGGTVFTPQLIEGAIPWLEEAWAASPDLAKRFDVEGIHTYAQYPPVRPPELGEDDDPPLEAKLAMHAWLLERHGAEDKPLWITELGWPVQPKVDEAAQARYLVRAVLIAAKNGADALYWYTLSDGPKPSDFPPEDAFGLLRNDGTKKPAYGALKALLATMGERLATNDDPQIDGLPSDGHAIVFRGGGSVIALWTVDAKADVKTRVGGALVDQAGNSKGTVAAGGSIAIGPDVVYLVRP